MLESVIPRIAPISAARTLPIRPTDTPARAELDNRWMTRADVSMAVAFGIAAMATRVVFWAYTGRVWEDALITILHARNAVRGLGLTHFKLYEGRVHGFTSPLSVLIPLLGEAIQQGWGLKFIRMASILASGVTVGLAVALTRLYPGLQMPAYGAAIGAGYVALEHHQTLWGMAGMETQVATCILLLALVSCRMGSGIVQGLALALCLYARPDLAFVVCILGCVLVVRSIRTRKASAFVVPFIVAVATYAPWLVFTTLYYGSPLPNTVRAKATYGIWWQVAGGAQGVVRGALERLRTYYFAPLGPCFGGNGTGFVPFDHRAVATVMVVLLVIGLAFAVRRKQADLAPVYAIVGGYAVYYTFAVPIAFGWYVVPFAPLSAILAAKGFGDLVKGAVSGPLASRIGWTGAIAYIFSIACVLPLTYTGEKRVQELVEEPVRIAIGKWLHANTPPDATVGGEPLGFIGWYSDRNYFDYPGLTSRRTADFLNDAKRRRVEHGVFAMLAEFRPDYIILRNFEVEAIARSDFHRHWSAHEYERVREFAVPEEDRKRLLFPAFNIDLSLTLLRRKELYRRLPLLDIDRMPEAPRRIITQAKMEGWSPDGVGPGSSALPAGRHAYGSWRGSDANTGRIAIEFQAETNVRRIAVPVLTGPSPEHLSLKLLDLDSGQVVAELSPVPEIYTRWKVWVATLSPAGRARRLAVVAEDAGTGWGEWMAVADPEEIR